MRFSVSHNLAERSKARNVLVRAQSEDGIVGWGECCPRSYLTGETVESVLADLCEDFLPRLLGRKFEDFADLAEYLASTGRNIPKARHAAYCAAELAMLDAAGRTWKRCVGDVLSGWVRGRVRYSGVIATNRPEAVKKKAWLMRLFGFNAVKIKVQRDSQTNLELLRTARSVLGQNVSIRIDANCAWSCGEAIEQIKAMAAFGLDGVEQPVAAEDTSGMSRLTAERIVPVIADESLCSVRDAERLIESRACDMFNIRVSKCGGLLNSLAIYQKAMEAGLNCQLGAQVGETAVLSAAGRHIATHCKHIQWAEGSYGRLLLRRDLARPDLTIGPGGWAPALRGPGLGIRPVQGRVDRHSVHEREVTVCNTTTEAKLCH